MSRGECSVRARDIVAGLLGGLVSSTNVTFTFARTSRVDDSSDRALAFGAIGANAMLYPRVMLAVAVLNCRCCPSSHDIWFRQHWQRLQQRSRACARPEPKKARWSA